MNNNNTVRYLFVRVPKRDFGIGGHASMFEKEIRGRKHKVLCRVWVGFNKFILYRSKAQENM